MISNIDSNYDIEVMLNGNVIHHLLHLLFDAGKIQTHWEIFDIHLTVLTDIEPNVNRTYMPASNYVSNGNTPGALNADILFFESVPDYFYLRVRLNVLLGGSVGTPPGFPWDGYFKIRKVIDPQALFLDVQNVLDEAADKVYLAPYLQLVSIQYGDSEFDPLDPLAGPSQIPTTTYDMDMFIPLINMYLDTALNDALKEPSESLLEIVQGQTDLLGLMRMDLIAFNPFPDNNNLGVYINFILLDHDRGYVGDRGDKESGKDYLGVVDRLGLATSPNFLPHLVDDVLIKTILKEDLENGDLRESEIETRLLFDHYPLRFPYSLLGLDLPVIPAYIKNVVVGTVNKKFETTEGNKQKLDALKITVKVDEYLISLFELPSENLVVYLAPFTANIGNTIVPDVYVETNLRLDLARSLFNVLGPLGWLATAVLNIFLKKEMLEDSLSNMLGTNPLAILNLITQRWDPFYVVKHGLLQEYKSHTVQDEQLLFRLEPHLDKQIEPYETVYVRDYEMAEIGIGKLLYRVHKASEIITETFYASDREAYELRRADSERDIYALSRGEGDGSVESRIDNNKLCKQIIYAPYCIEKDEDSIVKIGLLTDYEIALIRSELKNNLRHEITIRLMEHVLAVFEQDIEDLSQDDYDILYDILYPSSEVDPEYVDFVENDIEQEIEHTIISEPNRIRLRPTPEHLDTLLDSLAIRFPNYDLVHMDSGTIYFRNIANDSTADNLLSLPNCS